ncbi:class III extradiol ring-cleavage dioxygenase [Alteromonas gracilis]|uniref:DODA-type extradiol aromatic ring-opening family dioxygenase n=1 Tax=Alteromonas gracilis TaxID=1479524 RepID=UPI0036F36A09
MVGSTQITTAYISHGGGPLPLLEMQLSEAAARPNYHREMIDVLTALSEEIPKPNAIVVVSAHWESREINVTTNAYPTLNYDYYGFPEEAYSIRYDAKGEPSLATSIVDGLNKKGINASGNETRGFDHGMFIPLSIMYPDADIPVVQLSLAADLNAAKHVALGEALRDILAAHQSMDRILVLGSGSSFHNMKGFFDNSDVALKRARNFNAWLQDTVHSSAYSESERKGKLIEWFKGPNALYAHPREEHLLPLHVCYGLNNRASDKAISLTLLTKPASMFMWQNTL